MTNKNYWKPGDIFGHHPKYDFLSEKGIAIINTTFPTIKGEFSSYASIYIINQQTPEGLYMVSFDAVQSYFFNNKNIQDFFNLTPEQYQKRMLILKKSLNQEKGNFALKHLVEQGIQLGKMPKNIKDLVITI